MTRLIRFRRISGKRTETRRCAPGRALAAALAASVAALAIGGVSSFAPTGAVLAQTPGTAGPVSLGDLFAAPDSPELKPGADKTFRDAARKTQAAWDALAPGQCPKPKITVSVPKGNDLFQEALAFARRDILKARLGGDADKFNFVVNSAGATNNVEIDTSVADTEPPTITVTPPSGTKVKNGQRLTISVTAAEPTNGWQAGVKQIQIEDLDRHTNLAPWDNPAPAPRPCGNAGLTHTIERSYVVPPNVPVAHLKITARDYHNPQQVVLVEYPTGDWHGRIDWWIPAPSSRVWGRLDLTFDYDGKGNLTGRMAGDSYVKSPARGEFCGMTTQTPAKLSAKLVGQYTPGRNTMSLRVAEPYAEQGQFSMCAIGPGGGPLRMSGQPFGGSGPLGQTGLDQLLKSLTVKADGSVEASGEWPVTPASAQATLHMKLTLRRAQN